MFEVRRFAASAARLASLLAVVGVYAVFGIGSSANAVTVLDQQQVTFAASNGQFFYQDQGQSFTAGMNGVLHYVDLFANQDITGGTNLVSYKILDGSGLLGTNLGSGSQTFAGGLPQDFPLKLVARTVRFDLSSLNLSLVSGHAYTFLVTGITGAGSLASNGFIGTAGNTYAGGVAFNTGGTNVDMMFRTYMDPVPLPAALPLFASGLGLLAFLARRKKRKSAAAIAAA